MIFSKQAFRSVIWTACTLIFSTSISLGNPGHAYESNDRNILEEILEKSKDELSSSNRPVMIFDLDDTIFDAGSRTLAILKMMAVDENFIKLAPRLNQRLSELNNDDVNYEFSDNLDLLGIQDVHTREQATKYWQDRFFRLCDIDVIHEGAKDFLLRAFAAGSHIVYLTGRDQPRMMDCTLRSLQKNGLPLGPKATLMLKPNKDISDVVFKKDAFKDIAKLGTVTAGFDNEPANVNAIAEEFPEASVVFIETRHSNRPDQPFPAIIHYRWSR